MPEQSMLTTRDVASRLNVSADTALRVMRSEPGVVCLGSGARRMYRMPLNVFEGFIHRKAAKDGKAGKK